MGWMVGLGGVEWGWVESIFGLGWMETRVRNMCRDRRTSDSANSAGFLLPDQIRIRPDFTYLAPVRIFSISFVLVKWMGRLYSDYLLNIWPATAVHWRLLIIEQCRSVCLWSNDYGTTGNTAGGGRVERWAAQRRNVYPNWLINYPVQAVHPVYCLPIL